MKADQEVYPAATVSAQACVGLQGQPVPFWVPALLGHLLFLISVVSGHRLPDHEHLAQRALVSTDSWESWRGRPLHTATPLGVSGLWEWGRDR